MLRENNYKYAILNTQNGEYFQKWDDNKVIFTKDLKQAALFNNIPNSMKTRIQLASKSYGQMLTLKTDKFKCNENGEVL